MELNLFSLPSQLYRHPLPISILSRNRTADFENSSSNSSSQQQQQQQQTAKRAPATAAPGSSNSSSSSSNSNSSSQLSLSSKTSPNSSTISSSDGSSYLLCFEVITTLNPNLIQLFFTSLLRKDSVEPSIAKEAMPVEYQNIFIFSRLFWTNCGLYIFVLQISLFKRNTLMFRNHH